MALFRCGGGEDGKVSDWWVITSINTGGSLIQLTISNNGSKVKVVSTTEATSAVTIGPFVILYSNSKWNLSANAAYNITYCSADLPGSWSTSTWKAVLCLCR